MPTPRLGGPAALTIRIMLGTRGRIAGAAVVAALGLSGCWLQPRGNAARTGFLPGPQALSSATAADLTEAWRAGGLGGAVNEPIVNGNWVIVTTATSGVAASYNADNGALRWREEDEFRGGNPTLLTDPVWHDDTVQIGVDVLGVPPTIFQNGGVAVLSPGTGAVIQPDSGGPAALDLWVGADREPRVQLTTRVFGVDFGPFSFFDEWYAWGGAKAGYTSGATGTFYLPMTQAVEVGGNLVWGSAQRD